MLPSKRRPRDGAIDPRKDISGLGNSTRLTGPINWTKTDGIRAGAHFAPEPRDRGYGGAPRLAARGPSMAGEHDGKAPFFAVEKSRGDAAQRAFCPAPPSPPGSSRRRRASYAPPGPGDVPVQGSAPVDARGQSCAPEPPHRPIFRRFSPTRGASEPRASIVRPRDPPRGGEAPPKTADGPSRGRQTSDGLNSRALGLNSSAPSTRGPSRRRRLQTPSPGETPRRH